MDKYLEIGQIVNTFGIKGMVKVKPFSDDIRRFDKLKNVYIKKNSIEEKYIIEEVKYHKQMVIIKFKGIDKIEEAELLKNSYILINREDEEPLEEGVYYIVDLLGLDVYTDENILLGNLEDIYNTGSNDIYVVKDENGKQILLPGIPDVIKEVDIENKKIIVHLLKRTNLNMEDIMKFDVLTLFPEMFDILKSSVIGKALEKELIKVNLINIRDFSKDKHKKVDDTPYGGGAGMVIRPDVVYDAYCSIENRENVKVIYMSPQGKKLDQNKVEALSKEKHLVILCGHYEGIDQRVLDKIVDEEISIGDYVLTRW